MSSEDVELLRQLYARFERRDYASTRDRVRSPGRVHANHARGAAGPGGPGVWHGVDEMWRAVADWLRHWEDLRHEPEEIIDLGDRVLVLTRQTARGRLSGAPVEQEIAELVTVRDGRIVRWEIYYDRAKAMRAADYISPNEGL